MWERVGRGLGDGGRGLGEDWERMWRGLGEGRRGLGEGGRALGTSLKYSIVHNSFFIYERFIYEK